MFGYGGISFGGGFALIIVLFILLIIIGAAIINRSKHFRFCEIKKAFTGFFLLYSSVWR